MRIQAKTLSTGAAGINPQPTRTDTAFLRQTLRIATATRAELELLCLHHGINHQGLPTSTLRQALKQRIGR